MSDVEISIPIPESPETPPSPIETPPSSTSETMGVMVGELRQQVSQLEEQNREKESRLGALAGDLESTRSELRAFQEDANRRQVEAMEPEPEIKEEVTAILAPPLPAAPEKAPKRKRGLLLAVLLGP